MKKAFSSTFKYLLLLVALGLLILTFVYRQAIEDRIRLLGYTPPAAITKIAAEDTMTPAARHLFYLNQPKLEDKQAFRTDCPNGSEKTIVLGCYKSSESGIYLLKVDDPRLAGVEQVTAAHEMLHAAYDRLSSSEKARVNGWLESYFKSLSDKRLIDTINAYKQTEPHSLEDEMHSIFGSEVADLPPNLANYYKRYFTDRSKVADYAASYRSTFIKLKQQLQSYDQELKELKTNITNDKAEARSLINRLTSERGQLNAYRARNDADAYNAAATTYNANVDRYNQLAVVIESEVNRYNQIVDKRNQLAVTINGLSDELNANIETVKQAPDN